MDQQALATLRGHVADIICGAVFVFVGLSACSVAAMRRRAGVQILVWLGIWSAMFGERPLLYSLRVLGVLPHWIERGLPFVDTVFSYLILVVAVLAWRELSLGKLRVFLGAVALVGLAIALAGVGFFLGNGAANKLAPYNNLLAACTLAVLGAVIAVPKLTRKFMAAPSSGVLLAGTLAFAAQAVYTNVLGAMGRRAAPLWGTLGFALLLFSFAYVSLQMVFANERRLQSIENELAIAREIQNSILPSNTPGLKNLRISAAYRPMTAVAGDFYEFIPIDQDRVGFLIADVTGHGVPAALIAAMIKVAMQSIVPCAHDPREVLRGLNRVLFHQLRDQFVSAAYLMIDTQNAKALYSAAGHPPLLRWHEGRLERVESNGIVFGVNPEPDYPVRGMSIRPRDRFLLYTDGVIEPQNGKSEFFGDRMLEQVVRNHQGRTASELVDQLLAEIRNWQPPSTPQQDDITLIVVDIL